MASSNRQIVVQYAILYGLISVAILVIQYVMGVFSVGSSGDSRGFGWTILSVLPSVLFPLLALLAVRKQNEGFLKFGEGFKHSFTIFMINSLFIAGWMLTYTLVLEPGYQEELLQQAYETMQEQGQDEEAIETSIAVTRKFTSPWLFPLWSVMGAIFTGAIISLILAALLQKRPPEEV